MSAFSSSTRRHRANRAFATSLFGFVLIVFSLCVGRPSGLGAQELYTPESMFRSAMQHNIELQKLEIEKRKAGIDRKNAEASALPTVDFQTTLTYQTNPLIDPITLTAGELGSYEVGGETVLLPMEDMVLYEGMENTWYEFKFIVDQPLITWGKIPNSIELYKNIENSSGLMRRKKEDEIKTKIYIYISTLYYLEKIEESMGHQSEDVERLINIAEESYKNGFILYTDLLEAKIQEKELRIAEAELEEQKEQAILALSQLSGIRDIQPDKFDYSFIQNIEEIDLKNREYYIQKAISGSPDIEMLNILRNINELRVEISKGSDYLKPDIGLHLELGYTGPRFPFLEADWYGEDSLGLNATLALQTRVFDGGKLKYQIEKDTAELDKAFHEYEFGLDSISHFITETMLKIELNKRNLEYYRLLQENDSQQINMLDTLFKAGSGGETELLKERIELNTNKIKEYKESVDFYKNYHSLLGASSLLND